MLCARCFKSTNHEGHDTFFAISSGSGGCCDCGDAEAWKVDLRCPFHSPDTSRVQESTRLPKVPEVRLLLKESLTTLRMWKIK